MTIIYRTDGAWGTGLGVNLGPAQVDGNFWDLQGRLTYIEDNPVEPIEPISITISGSQFSMGLSNGETLGPITMTMPVPLWRGAWMPSTFYNEMDYFTAPDGGFGVVIAPHTSATTFDWAATSGGQPVYQVIVGASGTTAALGDLVDVSLASEADGDLLVFNLATGYWQNRTKAVVATTILPAFGGDSGTGGLRGMVPAPAAGDAAAGKVLGAGGGWIVPAGGTGGSSSLAGLSDVAIVSPANLSLLQYQASDGKWHNRTLTALGAGTVTQVNSGTGLSGGPVTTTGTLSLAQIAALNLLANVTGSSAAPSGVTLSQLLDAVLGSTRGSILRRDGTTWSVLTPGTAGQYLKTGGTGADVSWDAPVGSGTVTSVATGAGLAGGPITSTGTLSLATIADSAVLANVSGSTAAPSATTPTLLLDHVFGSTQGQILYRSATAWTALSPGTVGQVLTTGGTLANPAWGSAGTSISIGDTPPSSPNPGAGWWDSVGGQLYIFYADGTSSQWVPASNQGTNLSLPLAIANGGTGATTAGAALTALGAAPIASPVFTGNPTAPTPAVGDNDTSIATTAFVQAAAAPAFNDVGRNLVHNPLFNIAQRGVGPWTTGYSADRWYFTFANGSSSFSLVAQNDGGRAQIGDEACITVAANTFVGSATAGSINVVQQPIEDVRRLAGKTVTVSFYASASAALKLGVSLNQAFGTGGSPSAGVIGNGVAVNLTTSWARYSLTFAVPSAAGKTFGTNGNSSTALLFWYSGSSDQNASTGSVGVQSGTVYLWGVQLEIGSAATPLEKPDPQQDLAKCQRFYQTGQVYAAFYQTAGGSVAATAYLPVLMRAMPTLAIVSNTSGNVSSASLGALNPSAIYLTGSATATAGVVLNSTFTASADL